MQERFSLLEEENAKLKMQMEKLKGKHKTEMSTMKQYLAESKLPGSALQPWFTGNEEHLSEDRTGLVKEDEEHRTGVVSYDDYALQLPAAVAGGAFSCTVGVEVAAGSGPYST